MTIAGALGLVKWQFPFGRCAPQRPRAYHQLPVPRKLLHLLHPRDNVATALVDLVPGSVVERPAKDSSEAGAAHDSEPIEVQSAIPFGHKLALTTISRGEPVIKYGEVIGLATADIAPGEHVHVHNVESQRGRGDLATSPRSQA